MTKEKFNELVDYMIEKSGKTLKEKNAKYAPENDALHNFHYGSQMDNSTTPQTIWHYWKKHMVALMDKINRNDWEDIADAEEKIQDSINYLLFIWCAANEEYEKAKNELSTNVSDNIDKYTDGDVCTGCESRCSTEWRSCECCRYNDIPFDENTGRCTEEPCKSCKSNFCASEEAYETAPYNWRPLEK